MLDNCSGTKPRLSCSLASDLLQIRIKKKFQINLAKFLENQDLRDLTSAGIWLKYCFQRTYRQNIQCKILISGHRIRSSEKSFGINIGYGESGQNLDSRMFGMGSRDRQNLLVLSMISTPA